MFTSDGQENTGKCPHQDSEGSDTSFSELSNGTDLKSPHKADGAGLNCNGAGGGTPGTPPSAAGAGPKARGADSDKKHPCSECGQAFRTKSYLNKHLQRVHGVVGAGKGGAGLGDLSSPSLSSPFSPQQVPENPSLLIMQ